MVSEYLDHLLPEVSQILRLDKKERIQHIQKDNWIGYSRAKQALNKLKELYECPQRHRMPNLLIIGPTNNGKTMIIEKFCRNYAPIVDEKVNCHNQNILLEMPIVSLQMLPAPDRKSFYSLIVHKISLAGANHLYFHYTEPYEKNLVAIFQKYNIKMLIIDEIHNMLAGRNDKQREFQNMLRYIGNALKIPIVCLGTKDAYLSIRSDPQLENRFEPFLLPTWKDGKEYESLLASIVSILPLKKISHLNYSAISKFILEKTDGILGEIFTLLRRAAILAIETGHECIDESILKKMDYHSPAERIKLFEQSIIC